MMNKYKQHLMILIQIGLKIKWFFLIIILSISLNCCSLFNWGEDKSYDYNYTVNIINELQDTFALTVNQAGFISASQLRARLIYPGENGFNVHPQSLFNNGEDPIEAYFASWNRDTVWCYSLDKEMKELIEIGYDTIPGLIIPVRSSLKYIWIGPLQQMPDSVNNFFNYNSWHDTLLSVDEGELVFTIK